MTDDEVRLLRAGGVGVSTIERLADEALRRGRVIVEAQALHRQAVADRARLEAALRAIEEETPAVDMDDDGSEWERKDVRKALLHCGAKARAALAEKP